MSYFEILNNTLEKSGFANIKSQSTPQQFYCKDYFAFKKSILNLFNKLEESNIFILTDGHPKLASLGEEGNLDQKILALLKENFNIHHKILSIEANVKPEEIHASEYFLKFVDNLVLAAKSNYKVFIALGSGTITDLLKHSLFKNFPDAVFITIPTALTVTAFTSTFSVLEVQGAKRTSRSKKVDYTFWLEPVLQAAPIELSRAGYGDLLARFVAYGDWYLGYKLGITEHYSEVAFVLMEPFSSPLKDLSKVFSNDYLNESATLLLSSALAMAGIAMSLSGETTPLSGYEHVISHGLDFLRLTSNRELVLHGEQVALGSLASAMTFDWILDFATFDEKKFRTLNEKEADKLILQFLKNAPFKGTEQEAFTINNEQIVSIKKAFLDDYMNKSIKWDEAKAKFPLFLQEFAEIKQHLRNLTIRAAELEILLQNAKLPLFPEGTTPSTTSLEYRWALRFSPFIRTRFSVADFIFWMGEDPCTVAAV